MRSLSTNNINGNTMRKEEIDSQKWFDNQAPVYDETDTMKYSKNPKISCKDVKGILDSVEYEQLLDIGCGTGYLFELINNGKSHYYGLDLSEKMLEVARNKNIPNTEYVHATAEKLPYPDESMDVITCIQSFHHYPYPDEALREALRVLKKGGIYILSDTGIGNPMAFIFNKIIYPRMHTGDCNIANRKSVERRMEDNGFCVTSSKQLTRMIYTIVARKD